MQYTGCNALLVQEKREEACMKQLEAELRRVLPVSDAYVHVSRDRLLADFRRRTYDEGGIKCPSGGNGEGRCEWVKNGHRRRERPA